MTKLSGGDSKSTLYCSFCGKSQHEVQQADRRPDRVHLRRMRRAVQRHHPRGIEVGAGQDPRRRSDSGRDLQGARRLCDRPEPRQARPLGRGPQPLQAAQPRRQDRHRGRARQVEHPADRPDRLRQDLARADAGADPRRAVHHGRRDHADRGRLCRRGRREHHPQAAPGVRLQCREGAARHRLHRRDRQDQPQVGQSVDHPRRVGRGRPAGAAEADGRHHRLRPAAGRPQASAAGIPAGRHDQHPVHLRRRLRRASKRSSPTACRASRSASAPMSPRPKSAHRRVAASIASPRIC